VTKYLLQGPDIVEFIKFLQLRLYDHVERMQNKQMPNQVTTATVEGTRDRERPCKRWRGKIQEDLNAVRIKKLVRDHWEWRKIVLEAKVHNRL